MCSFYKKICKRKDLFNRILTLQKPIVLTNGVFDILHCGHITYLAQARLYGSSLIIAVNTDTSVKKLYKGSNRPINTCSDRIRMLAALESVSLVVPFKEDTAVNIIQITCPQVYVKGGDYDILNTPEGKTVMSYGGAVLNMNFQKNYSTSNLVKKIQEL